MVECTMMRKAKIAAIAILMLVMILSVSKCSNGMDKQEEPILEPPQIELGYPHPAEIVVALELGWGDGEYELGYTNDEFEDLVKRGSEGIGAGPSQFCVDGEGSIYIDDTMNYRILKYSSSGEYLGEFEKKRITDRKAVGALGVAAGLDCIYLCEPDSSIIYRYRFQTDELCNVDFAYSGYDYRIHRLDVIYDGEGRTYVRGETNPQEGKWVYYTIDESFSVVSAKREISQDYALVDYIDDDGNFYFIPRRKNIDIQRIMYKADLNSDVTIVAQFPEDLDEVIVKDVKKPEDLAIWFGYYVTKEGKVMQNIETANIQYYPGNFYITRDLDAYFRQPRPYNPDDKSPFRIYKVEIDWDALIE
jgi:hypothetical protein